MAIKVYKGGSWVNTTGVSAIGKADRLSIGQTDTSLATSDKNYYLSFVDANHPHTSRQYEDFYTGIGITYSPISKSLGVGGVLYLSGQENNFQGSIRSYGGADKLFVIYNESAEGVIAINPANSAGLNDVGIATFKRGAAVANDDSYFRSNVSPPKDCTGIYNLGKPEEKWNNVYANCFIGNGSGLDGTGDWKEDTYKNLKAGTEAGQSITAQTCYNIFAGFKSGCLTTGAGGAGGSDQIADGNVFLGTYTGRCNTTGAYNFYGGYVAGRGKADSTSTGDANVFIGRSAGQEINTGSNNTFLGKYAGLGIDSGDNNILLGPLAGRHLSSASQVIALGVRAGFCNISGNSGVFLGTYAGRNVTSGGGNVAIGMNALRGEDGVNITGAFNVALGYAAGKTLGPVGAVLGQGNVFLGATAAENQTAGDFNVAIGYGVCLANTTSGGQLAIGVADKTWISGDSCFNIKPGRGIIDCAGSCGTSGQVLTSQQVAGTEGNPNDYYVKWDSNVSTATNADKVGIGTTTNAGGDDVQDYYVPFVRDNNDHNNRQYEQLYSGKLVYRYQASDDSSRVGINTDIVGQELNVYSKQFSGIRVKSSRTESETMGNMTQIGGLQFADSNNTTFNNGRTMSAIVGTVGGDLILKTGNDPTENGSYDRVTITPVGHVGIGTTNPLTDDINTGKTIKDYLEDNNKVLAVGIVTANEYYGTFKGTIDPGVTITLDKIEEGNTSAEVVDTGTDGHFLVKTEGTERLRIVADGRIGINSSTPGTGPGGSETGHGDYELDVVKRTSSEDAEIRLYNYATGSNNGTVMRFQIAGTSSANHIYFGDGQDSNAGGIVYSHGDDSMRFFTNSPNPAAAGERLRIGSSGQIGLGKDVSGTWTIDFGTDNQVLTSKGPNSAAVWQTVSGIPASTSTKVKVTKTVSETKLYLTGVKANDDGSEDTTVDKTVYQKTASTNSTFYIDTSNDTLYAKKIRGELVAASSWPDIQGNLTIQTNHLIPSSTVALTDGVITGGQNLGSESNKWAKVYAQEFDGALGGTADKAKQLEVTKDNDNGTAHYFGMIRTLDQSNPVAQTFYTDTALTYNPSSDTLQASNIKVTTKLNVTGNTVLGDSATADTITFTGKVDSSVLPKVNADDKDDTNGLDLGGSGAYWRTIYAREFKGSVVGDATSAQTLNIGTDNTAADRYLTFVADSGDGKNVYMDSELKYNSNTDTLTPVNLSVTGDTTLGTSLAGEDPDTTIFNSHVTSHIIPGGTLTSPGDYTSYNLGESTRKWNTVYANEFSGSFTGSIEKIKTTKSEDQNKTYLTFTTTEPATTGNLDSFLLTNPHLYFRSTSTSPGEKLTVDCQLDVTGNATFSENVTLGSGDTDDIVTFNSKVASHILPSHSATAANDTSGKDLGDSNNYWRKVYARDYAGTFTGTLTSRKIEMTGDVAWSVNFDASGDVTAAGTIQPAAVEESMINISNNPANGYFLQTNASGSLTWAQVDGGDGVSLAFTDLTDVPNAYTNEGSKLVAVKSTVDGLEFVSASNVGTDTYVTGASFVSITGGKQLQLTRNNSQSTLTANLTLSDLGGVNKFLDLEDVEPNSYDGQAHKFVRVNKPNAGNDDGTKLEFIDATNFNSDFSFIGLSDTPTAYAGGAADKDKYVRVNSSGNGLVFDTATISAGTVDISLAGDNDTYYPTFVSGTASGGKTIYQDTNGLTYNPSSNTLTTQDLSVTGNTTLGNAITDTVSWSARSGTILPSGDSGTQDLGSNTYKWGTIHANTITGSLSIDTDNTTVLYTKTVSGNKVAAGTGEFTFTETTSRNKLIVTHTDAVGSGGVVRASSKDDANYAEIHCDGGVEICRTISDTGGTGGAFLDFKDQTIDYDARIQLTTNVAGNVWNSNDRGGLLFETGGINHRHMLLTKDGVLGITTGTDENAIKANNGSDSWRYGFVPGIPRDANLNDAHNIDQHVVLDVNGTLMLRTNIENGRTISTGREGAQLVFNNSDDTVGFSVDVYGSTANNSTLRIIDEKTITGNRGTQRFAMNRDGAITFKPYSGDGTGNNNASNINADYGSDDDVLVSQGHDGHPIWKSLSALGAGGGATTKVTYIDSGSKTGNLGSSSAGGTQSISFQSNICGLIVICVGGGGGGGAAHALNYTEGGGGGAGGMNIKSYTTAQVDLFKNNGAYCEIGSGGAGGTHSGGIAYGGSAGGATFFRPKCTNGQIPGVAGNSCATSAETNSLYSLQIHTSGGNGGTGGTSSNSGGDGGDGGISYTWGDIALRGNPGQDGESLKIRGSGDDETAWGRRKPLGGITPFGVQFSPVSGYPMRCGWGKGGDGAYHAGQSGGMSGESGGSGAIIIIEILK